VQRFRPNPSPALPRQPRCSEKGFTLVELLVVVAVIGSLASMVLPGLAKAKSKAQSTRCASNMRNWSQATHLYLSDNDDHLPFFGELSTDGSKMMWHGKLAIYMARYTPPDTLYTQTEIFRDDIRRCPGGRSGPPPFAKTNTWTGWNCWVGANFGSGPEATKAPFYYADYAQTLPASRIARPDDAMLYMDSLYHGVYNPSIERYKLVQDFDGDGVPDSMAAYADIPFNYARPTVHENASNVTLLDGHVERVAYKKLWQPGPDGRAIHPFWRLDD
jgi:prepilin-type N-terminal cleavage/methylation domain-containing protein/prepilin-type processing-associated H-X9-DG protein